MNIEQIKREVDQSMTEYRHYRDNRDMARSIVNKTIDYLVSRGYLGGVPDGYVLVPKYLLENWVDYSTMSDFIADKRYPTLRSDTQKIIDAAIDDIKSKYGDLYVEEK